MGLRREVTLIDVAGDARACATRCTTFTMAIGCVARHFGQAPTGAEFKPPHEPAGAATQSSSGRHITAAMRVHGAGWF